MGLKKKKEKISEVKILNLKELRQIAQQGIDGWRYPEKTFPAEIAKFMKKYTLQDHFIEKEFKIPGVSKNDTVLAFASSYGEFSYKMLKGNVIHTDSDFKRVKIAKKKHEKAGKKLGYMVMDMYNLPIKKGKIDWLYSFDPPFLPMPIFMIEALSVVKKGIIIHLSPHVFILKMPREYEYGAPPLEIYKCKSFEADGPNVLTTTDKETEKSHFIVTLNSSAIMKRAGTDRKVIVKLNEIYEKKGEVSNEDLQTARKELKISKKKFRESLERIDRIVKFTESDEFFRVKI